MKEQQQLFKSQQEVSVWPYLENSISISISTDSAEVEYTIENKGIGPAIVGEVTYTFDGKQIELWGIVEALENKYKGQFIATQTDYSTLSNDVIAAGSVHHVTTLKIKKNANTNLNLSKYLEEISDSFQIEYCYCSVYHKCWWVDPSGEVKQSDRCSFRKEIR